MREIREIYQSWLSGDLSQEDALFAIGDLLDRSGLADDDADLLEDRQGGRQAAGQKGP